MSRESFGEKLDRGTESLPGDIDKIPPPESFPEPMPGEEPEDNSKLDINPEEHLLEESEVEEVYRKKLGDKTPVPEKKLDDLEINKKIIEARNTINKIESELLITTDQKKKEILEEFLKDAKSELEKRLNYR